MNARLGGRAQVSPALAGGGGVFSDLSNEPDPKAYPVFSIDEQVLHPFVGLPDLSERYPRTWRARPDGFWFVLPAQDSEQDRELWAVDANGAATLVGRYAHSEMLPGYGSAVSADGVLFETVYASGSAADYIQRRTFVGTELVYDEAGDPLVKLHGSRLVTAP